MPRAAITNQGPTPRPTNPSAATDGRWAVEISGGPGASHNHGWNDPTAFAASRKKGAGVNGTKRLPSAFEYEDELKAQPGRNS